MTQGFYKKQNEELLYGPNIIEGDGYVLLAQEKDSYEYPVDGWHWFDSEEAATEYFGTKSIDFSTQSV
jgi:hypothetical protein